jgi:hypothetical protein
MKIAICFFGLADGMGRKGREVCCLPDHGLQSLKRFVYQDYECDTYFHAWARGEQSKDRLIDLLQPKNFVAEEQREFDEDAKYTDYNLYRLQRRSAASIKERKKHGTFKDPHVSGSYLGTHNHGSLSQAHSRTESIKLALQSVEEEGTHYDFIVALRYDLFFGARIPYESLSQESLYVPINPLMWTQCDYFFIGSPSVMQHMLPIPQFLQKQIEEGTFDGAPESMLQKYYAANDELTVAALERPLHFRRGFWMYRYIDRHVRERILLGNSKKKVKKKNKAAKPTSE